VARAQRPFERFLLRAGIIAAATVALSLGLIALGVSLSGGFWKTLVITVATAILSIGGISFIYETYLRRTLTQDVLSLVQLEEKISESGIKEVSKRSSVAWHDFFSGAETVRLLPIDPVAWLVDEWLHVTDATLHRDPEIEIYLPNPAGDALATIAARLGRSPDQFGPDVQRVLTQVEGDCKTLHTRHRSGRYSIFTYDGAPGFGLAVADERFILSVPRLLDVPGAAQIIALRFTRGDDRLMTDWVREQLDELPSTGTYFTT
jgi:hypothetical protein